MGQASPGLRALWPLLLATGLLPLLRAQGSVLPSSVAAGRCCGLMLGPSPESEETQGDCRAPHPCVGSGIGSWEPAVLQWGVAVAGRAEEEALAARTLPARPGMSAFLPQAPWICSPLSPLPGTVPETGGTGFALI